MPNSSQRTTPRHGRVEAAGIVLACALLAPLVLTAVAAADSRRFTVTNLSSRSWRLDDVRPGVNGECRAFGAPTCKMDFEGRPDDGATLAPGESHAWELKWAVLDSFAANVTYQGLSREFVRFNMLVNTTEGKSTCGTEGSGGSFSCKAGKYDLEILDAPGTVVEVPAARGQEQAQVLDRLCRNESRASCSFSVKSRREVLTPAHQIGNSLSNNTRHPQKTKVSIKDTVGNSNSVEVEVEVGGKVKGLVEVSVKAAYGHEWSTEHTFAQEVEVDCPAHSRCWIVASQPMRRHTGDFTLTMANTKWILRDVHFDTPNPDGNGDYSVHDRELTPEERARLPREFTGQPLAARSYQLPDSAADRRIARARLDVDFEGPSTVTPGGAARYRIEVDRNHPVKRLVYDVRGVKVVGSVAGRRVVDERVGRVGRRQQRVLEARVPVPRTASGQFCFRVRARAARAHADDTVACAQVTR